MTPDPSCEHPEDALVPLPYDGRPPDASEFECTACGHWEIGERPASTEVSGSVYANGAYVGRGSFSLSGTRVGDAFKALGAGLLPTVEGVTVTINAETRRATEALQQVGVDLADLSRRQKTILEGTFKDQDDLVAVMRSMIYDPAARPAGESFVWQMHPEAVRLLRQATNADYWHHSVGRPYESRVYGGRLDVSPTFPIDVVRMVLD